MCVREFWQRTTTNAEEIRGCEPETKQTVAPATSNLANQEPGEVCWNYI